ncbi:hypothetical protein [Celeribacter neptunius]|uniref:hypothetical protein n=1 Tax=Celeribacter neptunius TaxID=588602 RepID=UPI0011607FF7|nr:hypothetical protein [Celeribacter neptunius]
MFSDLSAWLTGLLSLLAASVVLGIAGRWVYHENWGNAGLSAAISALQGGFALLLLLQSGLSRFERYFSGRRLRLAMFILLWLFFTMLTFQSQPFVDLFGPWFQELALMALPLVTFGFLLSHVRPGLAYSGMEARVKPPGILGELRWFKSRRDVRQKGWLSLLVNLLALLPLFFIYGGIFLHSLPTERGFQLMKSLGLAYAAYVIVLLLLVFLRAQACSGEGPALRLKTPIFAWTVTLIYLLSPFIMRPASTIVWVSNFVTENPVETHEYRVLGAASMRSKFTCKTPLKVQLVPETETGIVCVGAALEKAARPGQTLTVRGEAGPFGVSPQSHGLLN